MSFSVSTNNEAMAALRLLSQTNKSLSSTQERINSGLKVNNAKDDASTFAIAQGMRGDVASFKAIQDSLALGSATANIASNAATKISDTLNDIKAKITSAQAESVDRASIQNDITALLDQIDTIANGAQFNGVNLINGGSDMSVLSSLNRASASSAPTAEYITVAAENLTAAGLGINGIDVSSQTAELKFDASFAGGGSVSDGDVIEFQAGGNTYTFEFIDDPSSTAPTDGDNIVVEYDAADSAGQVLSKLVDKMKEQGFSASYNDVGNLVVSHRDGLDANVTSTTTGFVSGTAAGGDPSAALTTIETAISSIKSSLAALGTSVNRLDTQKEFMSELSDSMESGIGQLVDADLAEESARLQALQTKQQLGLQALSIANQGPSAVLSLFR